MEKMVFDTSALISASERCMLRILENISREEHAEFIITESVYQEAVRRPLEIKRFEYNAVRIDDMVRRGIIRMEKTTPEVSRLTGEIQAAANSLFRSGSRYLEVVQLGEAEALALMKTTGASILVIDERTTRMMIEQPESMAWLIERRTGKKVDVDKANLRKFSEMFSGIRMVRSVELFALAYERGYFGDCLPKTKVALEAGLYALKYAGCAVTVDEIKEFLGGA